jgi:hypothetical protein
MMPAMRIPPTTLRMRRKEVRVKGITGVYHSN